MHLLTCTEFLTEIIAESCLNGLCRTSHTLQNFFDMDIKVIERGFKNDEQENDFYLELCEKYNQVSRNLILPNNDGSVYAQYYVSGKI